MIRIQGLPAVEVSINGSAPYPFVIDWGSNLLAVSARVAAALRLPSRGVDDMGNAKVEVATLSVGAARFSGLTAAVDPFFDGKQEQGVLGVNVYAALLLTLDFPRGVVVLERGSLPRADGQRVFDCGSNGGDPEPAIEILVADHRIRALIDTAASRLVMLPETLAAQLGLQASPIAAGTVTGPQTRESRPREARLKGDLKFGAFTVRDPILAFHARPRAFLGTALLERFAVTLDQEGRRVRFSTDTPMPIKVPRAQWE